MEFMPSPSLIAWSSYQLIKTKLSKSVEWTEEQISKLINLKKKLDTLQDLPTFHGVKPKLNTCIVNDAALMRKTVLKNVNCMLKTLKYFLPTCLNSKKLEILPV